MAKVLSCSEIWGGGGAIDTDFRMPGFEGALFSHPASGSAGGDVYLISNCNMGQVCKLVLADVAGHGERVTRAGQMLADLLRANIAERDNDAFLRQLNQRFEAEGGGREVVFATLACGTYFTQTRRFAYGYAGHPQIIHGRDGVFTPLDLAEAEPGGIANVPLGVEPGAGFHQGCVELAVGDWLIFCTDGLLEARNGLGQEYGLPRLLGDLRRLGAGSPMAMKNGLLTRVRDFAAPRRLDQDDLTLIVLTLREVPARPIVGMAPEIEKLMANRRSGAR